MEEKDYEVAFRIIAEAGDSKGYSMEAIQAARAGEFKRVKSLLRQAEEGMRRAHDLQFDMIQKEAAGTPASVNIILIHAQDHLAMAMMAKDMAEEMTMIYRELRDKENEGDGGIRL